MKMRSIKTDGDYREALREIETLMASRENTATGNRLDALVSLVEHYERANFLDGAVEVDL